MHNDAAIIHALNASKPRDPINIGHEVQWVWTCLQFAMALKPLDPCAFLFALGIDAEWTDNCLCAKLASGILLPVRFMGGKREGK